MLESKQILAYDDPSKTFLGVRFVLLGFDSVKEDKVRSKLLEGGGVDAANYGPDCSHVIVDNLAYDDPICVAARRDGKILVTGIWVDHSFDLALPVDPTSVMYMPMRDLNGIQGAKSLVICLTGYQRQDRDDIMTMVSLMGANFSKPLVANKVTHLICYKFEGEKYELAKKMKKIKLVNHCWLEDCLKAWELLPEADYGKSGYELEMEAEAKDSEEGTEDMAYITDIGRKNASSPQNTGAENKSTHQSSPKEEFSRNSIFLSASKSLADIGATCKPHSTPGKEIDFEKVSFSREGQGKHLEKLSFSSARSPGIMSSEVPSNMGGGTMISERVEHVLASESERTKKSPNAEGFKSSSKSYFRSPPMKSSLPLGIESNAGSLSASNVSKHGVSGGSGMPLERLHDGMEFGVKTPLNGTMLHLYEEKAITNKGEMNASLDGSKSPTLIQEPKRSVESELVTKTAEMLASRSSIDGSHRLAGDISSMTVASHLREEVSLAPIEALNICATSQDRQDYNDQMLQPSHKVKDLTPSQTDNCTGEVEMHKRDGQSTELPLPRTNPVVEKKDGQTNSNSSKVEHSDSQSKPIKRKMLAKKTLGSRPTISKTAKQKGSINLQKAVLQNGCPSHSNGALAIEDSGNNIIAEKDVTIPPAADEDRPASGETEAPEQSGQNGYGGGYKKERSAEVELSHSGKRKKRQADGKILQMELVEKNVGDKSNTEVEKVVCSKRTILTESKPKDDVGEKKLPKGKKRPLIKSRTNKLDDPREEVEKNGSNSKQDEKKTVSHNKETVVFTGKTKTRTCKRLKSSADVEKENKPVKIGQQSVSNDSGAGKVASRPLKNALKDESKADKTNASSLKDAQNLEVKTEPAWFILSGHKLQRKEFQKIIRRLKGRLCRDSHHWSYQATHFIVPDPIRRTEKFFAAAASGSWILKTDYLTASNEAGKFLSEEPYEWHKKCLSEDGAINLVAPRKWRLLKERTGHGAFYGLRIIIYGECIAPPLDTLKRVVKAGDGTILATSPPYSRFLQSRIDFAIVSPGMPRVDLWVQEFLRHEVPCVVADYLVEHVCKPGYSLERHVLYNTHAWAEKSLKNLVDRVEEDVEDVKTPEGHCIDDVACQVCGHRDRGEEMLICGDENGTVGCGVGIHIDCLDPPLEDVPEEDWFCPACS